VARTDDDLPGAVVTPTRMRSWVPHNILLLSTEILEQLLHGLFGKEPQGQLAQRSEVVGADVVGKRA